MEIKLNNNTIINIVCNKSAKDIKTSNDLRQLLLGEHPFVVLFKRDYLRAKIISWTIFLE